LSEAPVNVHVSGDKLALANKEATVRLTSAHLEISNTLCPTNLAHTPLILA